MPMRDDISKELEGFGDYWRKLCKELETTEMTKGDAIEWRDRFQIRKDGLMLKLRITVLYMRK